ncbi:MAG TPA: carbohydrate-binding family 9-like protein [Opitutaceae bacterium]|nr:carbohydrate-binding family 9-like protein [Opitutaceae bacterium]
MAETSAQKMLPTMIVPQAKKAPAVMAVADDSAWSAALWTTLQPSRGERSLTNEALTTEVAAQWDERFLYVRFRARGLGVSAHGNQHDASHHEGEVVEVFLDATVNQRGFVELQLSPAGGVLDKLWTLKTPIESDADGVLTTDYIRNKQHEDLGWTLMGLRTAAKEWKPENRIVGWIADFAIPWASVPHGSIAIGARLRAHFLRLSRASMDVTSSSFTWAPVPVGRPHRAPALMGILELAPPSAPAPAKGNS